MSSGRKPISFNPRPPRRAGATHFPFGKEEVPSGFQSSPAPKGGRYTVVLSSAGQQAHVSILARPEGRALQAMQSYSIALNIVSILARPEGRALP